MSEPSAHQRRIDALMAKVYRREGHTFSSAAVLTPLDAMLAAEEAVPMDEQKVREEGVHAWLGWIFEEGPHVATVMKRLFVFVRGVRPELILNMSGAEIAALFGQGRAAESARCNLLLEKLKKKANYRTLALPFQKSATTKQKYAQAQRGNKHRANSVTSRAAHIAEKQTNSMSIQSRLRNEKQPTSSSREHHVPQPYRHPIAQKAHGMFRPDVKKTGGAFGGVAKWKRKAAAIAPDKSPIAVIGQTSDGQNDAMKAAV
jgi:hypothetical protein